MDLVKVKCNILIADGGGDENFINKIEAKNFSNIDFQYKYHGFDSSYQKYYKKIHSALSDVSTPYSVLADDDDFFLAGGLQSCLDFLEKNKEFSSCGGIQGGIFNDSISETINGNYRLTESPYQTCSLNHDDAIHRVKDHLSNYSAIYYDIHRTKEIKDIYKSICDLRLTDLYVVEHYFQLASLINGKNKKIQTSYIVRQHNNPVSSALYSAKGGTLNRIRDNSWSDAYILFIDSLLMRLTNKHPDKTKESLYMALKESYESFLNFLIEKEGRHQLKGFDKIKSKLRVSSIINIFLVLPFFLLVKLKGLRIKNNKLSLFSKLKIKKSIYKPIVFFLKSHEEL